MSIKDLESDISKLIYVYAIHNGKFSISEFCSDMDKKQINIIPVIDKLIQKSKIAKIPSNQYKPIY